jgi:hypothetical protein
MATASRAAVVVNKADLVGDNELAEVVAFTSRVVAERLGQPVPVFALSALAARRRSDGFDTFAAWLAAELQSHGSAHALASTARALHREATVLRDALRVQGELLRRRGEDGAATLAALSEVLDRAGDRSRAAVDHVHGQAQRLRGQLDESHDKAVAGAVAASVQILAKLSEHPGDRSPEDLAERPVHGAEVIRVRAQDWYTAITAELDTGMRQAASRAIESLRAELAQARRAAGELLRVKLSDVIDLPGVEPAQPPPSKPRCTPAGKSWSRRRSSVDYPLRCGAVRCYASWTVGGGRPSRSPLAEPAPRCRTACVRPPGPPSGASMKYYLEESGANPSITR